MSTGEFIGAILIGKMLGDWKRMQQVFDEVRNTVEEARKQFQEDEQPNIVIWPILPMKIE